MAEAAEALKKILSSPEVKKNQPVLILANKQDIPGAMSPADVIDSLFLFEENRPIAVIVVT